MAFNVQRELDKVTPYLTAYALKLTGSRNEADDLYQDTAFKIIANADKYQPNTNFKAWVTTIMRNTFINNLRKKSRKGVIFDQTPNNYYINSGSNTIENGGEGTMRYKELMRMIYSLSDDFRVPFWMAYQGYKYEEIADKLDLSLGTIKSRIFFARKKLKKMYSKVYTDRQERA